MEQFFIKSPFCFCPEHTGNVMHIPASGFMLFKVMVVGRNFEKKKKKLGKKQEGPYGSIKCMF